MILKLLPFVLVICLFFCACGNKPAVTTDPASGDPVATDPSSGEPVTNPDTEPQDTVSDEDSLFTFPEDLQGVTLPFVEFEYDPVITPVPTDPTEPVVTDPPESTPVDTTPEGGIQETLPFHEFD